MEFKPVIKFAEQPGFQIDPLSCWQAVSSDCRPFSLQPVAERPEGQVILRQPCHPTARSAILAAVLSQKTLILARARKCVGLTPREASPYTKWYGLFSNQFPPLALECECRCKTALVINCPLPSWDLRQLGQSRFWGTLHPGEWPPPWGCCYWGVLSFLVKNCGKLLHILPP